ncbi:MAG: hypothetical protein KGL39_23570 [Patescibacteria group bacterium]|nr:hypothetical protein [Patescibacteria group bacterium]
MSLASIESNISLGLGLLASAGQKVDIVGIFSNDAGQTNNTASGLSINIVNSILGLPNATPSIGQLFTNARPLTATVRETSRILEHPAETGIIVADHHIINPILIEIPLLVTAEYYGTVYSQIRQAFLAATSLAVKTRVGVYSDMVIAEMPHDEKPDMYDAIVINLRLKQVIYVVAGNSTQAGGTLTNFQPLEPANSNTVASGIQQAGALGTKLLSSASGILSYARLL